MQWTFHCWHLHSFTSVCYTRITSCSQERVFKTISLPLTIAAASTKQWKLLEKSYTHIHVKLGKQAALFPWFKMSSISRKGKCYNIQLDEQLKTRIYSDTVLEFRIYVTWCLDETKKNFPLNFSKPLNEQLEFKKGM